MRSKQSSLSLESFRSLTHRHIGVDRTSKFVQFHPNDVQDVEETEEISNTFRIYNCEATLIRRLLQWNGFTETQDEGWTILWGAGLLRSSMFLTLQRFQKINHFPRSMEITRKDSLFKNLSRMQALHSAKHYGFFPKTFLLPSDSQSLAYEMSKDKTQVWILKPCTGSQGRGIHLIRESSEIPRGRTMVACKYISNPLLINGLKFDLRIYVAVTCINPLRLYIYEEGLVRFATVQYSTTELENRFVHLTNYSINKFSPGFSSEEGETGSKWRLTGLKRYMESQGIEFSVIWRRIVDIVIKTVISMENSVNSAVKMYVPHRSNCFELLGFDILLDEKLSPWLLEVNLSPSLNCDSSLDSDVKSQLIADLFTLIGVERRQEEKDIWGFVSERHKGMKHGSMDWKNDHTKEEAAILKESVEESKRMGKFVRVFPSYNSNEYLQFFDEHRPLNTLLIDHFAKNRERSLENDKPKARKLRPLAYRPIIPRVKKAPRKPFSNDSIAEILKHYRSR